MSNRLSVSPPPFILKKVKEVANKQGTSQSKVVCEALRRYFSEENKINLLKK